MLVHLARRAAVGVLVVIGASALVFLATSALPGDVARFRLPLTATETEITAERALLGLDRPLVVQFLDWLGGVGHGDLGTSWTSGASVGDLLLPALGNSASLLLATVVVVVPLGIGLALWAGLHPGGIVDRVVLGASMLAVTVPPFLIGALAVLVFAIRLRWLPAISSPDPALAVLAQPRLLVLPVAVLAAGTVGYITQVVRAQVVAVAASDHVEWARLRGVGGPRLLWFHVLPGLAPVAGQTVALAASSLLTGGVVVEVVFAYPGLGVLLQSATATRDIPLVQAVALLGAVIVVTANLLSEVVTGLLVPRGAVRA